MVRWKVEVYFLSAFDSIDMGTVTGCGYSMTVCFLFLMLRVLTGNDGLILTDNGSMLVRNNLNLHSFRLKLDLFGLILFPLLPWKRLYCSIHTTIAPRNIVSDSAEHEVYLGIAANCRTQKRTMHHRMRDCISGEGRKVMEGGRMLRIERGEGGGVLTGDTSVEGIERGAFGVELGLCAEDQRLYLVALGQTDAVVKQDTSLPAVTLH
jgi:hypothetical protein